jgi:hypothetical protein
LAFLLASAAPAATTPEDFRLNSSTHRPFNSALDLSTTTTTFADAQIPQAKINGLTTALSTEASARAAADTSAANAAAAALASHTSNVSNPHAVTKAQINLGSADNTSDANKPVSTAQQTALNGKETKNVKRFSVKDYGATGDGTTNDLTAIRAAIAALTSHSQLYFPPGKYKVDNQFTFSGLNDVLISGDSAEIYLTSGHSNTFIIDSTCSNITVSGLSFTGDLLGTNDVVFIRIHASDSAIIGNFFNQSSEFNIFVGDELSSAPVARVIVRGNIITNSAGDSIHVSNATDVNITGNVISHSGDDGIGIGKEPACASPARINVIGNSIYDSASRGIAVWEANDVTVRGNTIKSTVRGGVEVTRYLSTSIYSSRITVADNQIVSASSAGQASITMYYANDSTVTGNTIVSTGAGNGIAFLDANHLVIAGNSIKDSPGNGIAANGETTNVATGWSGITIKDNILDGNASEAIRVVPGAGITISKLSIVGNTSFNQTSGNYIYADQVTTGQVRNNNSLAGLSIGLGGAVSGVIVAQNNAAGDANTTGTLLASTITVSQDIHVGPAGNIIYDSGASDTGLQLGFGTNIYRDASDGSLHLFSQSGITKITGALNVSGSLSSAAFSATSGTFSGPIVSTSAAGTLFDTQSGYWGSRGNSQALPPSDNGTNAVYAQTDNFSNSLSEIDIFNTATGGGGFRFLQKTGATTKRDLVWFDGDNTPGNTPMILWDSTSGTAKRVSVGAADSGGAGYRVLRIAN